MSKKLGELVKDARAKKGLTQAELAKKVSGLTAADVSAIERGEKEPTQAALKEMAKALGVTQTSLLAAAGKTTAKKKTESAAAATTSSMKLTAAEKKLVQLYRKADADTKKAALTLLEGKEEDGGLLGSLLGGEGGASALQGLLGSLGGGSSDSGSSSPLGSLLGGLGGGSSSGSGGSANLIGALLGNLMGKKEG